MKNSPFRTNEIYNYLNPCLKFRNFATYEYNFERESFYSENIIFFPLIYSADLYAKYVARLMIFT